MENAARTGEMGAVEAFLPKLTSEFERLSQAIANELCAK
jgi:hypothetical protein